MLEQLTLEQIVISYFFVWGLVVNVYIFRFLINFEYAFFVKLIKMYRIVFDKDSLFKIIPICFRTAKKVKHLPSEKSFYERLFDKWIPKEVTAKPTSRGDYHDTH